MISEECGTVHGVTVPGTVRMVDENNQRDRFGREQPGDKEPSVRKREPADDVPGIDKAEPKRSAWREIPAIYEVFLYLFSECSFVSNST